MPDSDADSIREALETGLRRADLEENPPTWHERILGVDPNRWQKRYKFIQADYSGLELRMAAQIEALSRAEERATALERGQRMHQDLESAFKLLPGKVFGESVEISSEQMAALRAMQAPGEQSSVGAAMVQAAMFDALVGTPEGADEAVLMPGPLMNREPPPRERFEISAEQWERLRATHAHLELGPSVMAFAQSPPTPAVTRADLNREREAPMFSAAHIREALEPHQDPFVALARIRDGPPLQLPASGVDREGCPYRYVSGPRPVIAEEFNQAGATTGRSRMPELSPEIRAEIEAEVRASIRAERKKLAAPLFQYASQEDFYQMELDRLLAEMPLTVPPEGRSVHNGEALHRLRIRKRPIRLTLWERLLRDSPWI